MFVPPHLTMSPWGLGLSSMPVFEGWRGSKVLGEWHMHHKKTPGKKTNLLDQAKKQEKTCDWLMCFCWFYFLLQSFQYHRPNQNTFWSRFGRLSSWRYPRNATTSGSTWFRYKTNEGPKNCRNKTMPLEPQKRGIINQHQNMVSDRVYRSHEP